MTPRPARPSQLDQLAAQIREEHNYALQALRAGVRHAIRAGELLLQAKAALPHGEWETWLSMKCKLSARTARVYLRLAKHYADQNGSTLPFSSIREALKLLAKSIPDEQVDLQEDLATPPLPEAAVSRLGDLWVLGTHRLLCADATSPEAVRRVLGDRKPRLMVTDPPYGVGLDSFWRNRAGINKEQVRGKGHTETSILGDARADWSEAFSLVPSIEVGYVWHSSLFTREVLDGLMSLGFLYPQQIIWRKTTMASLTRTHYWFAHEPCWYVRKKNAPWFGQAGETTVWEAASPKARSVDAEDKYDHPAQKPLELMRRPILNHTLQGELVYDPFLGSGTTLAAAELTGRVCCGIEIDPKHIDVAILRWEAMTGKQATLNGQTFDEVARERLPQHGATVSRLAAAG